MIAGEFVWALAAVNWGTQEDSLRLRETITKESDISKVYNDLRSKNNRI